MVTPPTSHKWKQDLARPGNMREIRPTATYELRATCARALRLGPLVQPLAQPLVRGRNKRENAHKRAMAGRDFHHQILHKLKIMNNQQANANGTAVIIAPAAGRPGFAAAQHTKLKFNKLWQEMTELKLNKKILQIEECYIAADKKVPAAIKSDLELIRSNKRARLQ